MATERRIGGRLFGAFARKDKEAGTAAAGSAPSATSAPKKGPAVAATVTPAKKAAPAKAAPVKKTAPAKAAPVKKAAPAKKTAPAKAAPVKRAAPAKKAAPVEKAVPVTKAAPAKAAPAKKAAPVKAAPAKAVPAKKAAPLESAAPARKAAPVNKAAPVKVASVPKADTGALTGDDAWTKSELATVRKELTRQVEELSAEIDAAEEQSATIQRESGGEGTGDEADAGTKTFEREHEMSLANNSRDLLLQVERALVRLDAGTYGRCENCGTPIPKGRLQAFPRATLCVRCKQREERR